MPFDKPFEKDPNEVGVLWEKIGPKGPYMTGTVGDTKVVVFRNVKKVKENQPDWRILKSVPAGERQATVTNPEPPAPADPDW